ncbi:Sinapine esterase [Handroanthus impetiginosus]|uniref:Sinapine esterase n=1 Tax=Handroanthus impetiginosus TaxID=429701 RepID=A0A2G9HMT8_9LAMI|nr:Sinapine esterase [Handroanthus impetiginosus]
MMLGFDLFLTRQSRLCVPAQIRYQLVICTRPKTLVTTPNDGILFEWVRACCKVMTQSLVPESDMRRPDVRSHVSVQETTSSVDVYSSTTLLRKDWIGAFKGVGASSSNKFSYASSACFKSIISFGDSLADTGNTVYLLPESRRPPHFTLPPYGETFFGHPTGRCSDGRLIIDFIAQELGLPFVAPFYGSGRIDGIKGNVSNFVDGVNFAVVGATALEDSFFNERGVKLPVLNASLVAQMGWFKGFLSKMCHTSSDCKKYLESSLVLVGEIGGNDYNHAFFEGIKVAEVQSFAPDVVKTIGSAIIELINLGAVTLMVPGNCPIGCSTAYLTYFLTRNMGDYDENGCIKWLNKFAEYHNELLRTELGRIQKLHPHATIIYADYYNAAMEIYRSPNVFGFGGGALKACCGGEGPYNMNFAVQCGYSPSKSCKDPSLYVNWDGVHLTEAAYKRIALGLLRGSYTTPRLAATCPRIFYTDSRPYQQ